MAKPTCRQTGKARYRDEITAKLHLSKIQNRSTEYVIPNRAYLCPFCKGWHLTSSEQKTEVIDSHKPR